MRIRALAESDVELVDRSLPLNRLDQHRRLPSEYLVAWVGDEPVGHALLQWPAPELELADLPELQDVFVVPAHRRQGIATALTAAAERSAASRGFDRLALSVGADNDAARLLYERAGYVDAGRPPKRVRGTILLRGKPFAIDDTLVYLVKELLGGG